MGVTSAGPDTAHRQEHDLRGVERHHALRVLAGVGDHVVRTRSLVHVGGVVGAAGDDV